MIWPSDVQAQLFHDKLGHYIMVGTYVQKTIVNDFVMNSQGDIEWQGIVIRMLNHWAEDNDQFVLLQIHIVIRCLCGFKLKGLKDGSLKGFILH